LYPAVQDRHVLPSDPDSPADGTVIDIIISSCPLNVDKHLLSKEWQKSKLTGDATAILSTERNTYV